MYDRPNRTENMNNFRVARSDGDQTEIRRRLMRSIRSIFNGNGCVVIGARHVFEKPHATEGLHSQSGVRSRIARQKTVKEASCVTSSGSFFTYRSIYFSSRIFRRCRRVRHSIAFHNLHSTTYRYTALRST